MPRRDKAAIAKEIADLERVMKLRKIDYTPVVILNRQFQRFQRTYRRDPVAFIHDCIDFRDGEGPTFYQDEIAAALLHHSRVCGWGPRGLGKSCLCSWLIHWGLLTVDDVKVPITAGAWRQLESFLWPEIHKWSKRLRWDRIGRDPYIPKRELHNTNIVLSKTALTVTASPADPAKIEGAHATERVFVIFDESKSVKDEIFDAAEGAFSKTEESLALALSTPGGMLGRFYEMCTDRIRYERWYPYHITRDMAIKSGRMDESWANKCRQEWGENNPIYRNHVEGEFAAEDERIVIPLEKVIAAVDRWNALNASGALENLPVSMIGVDPARKGDDKTVFAFAAGKRIIGFEEHYHRDLMETTGFIIAAMKRHPSAQVVLDVVGIGAGVYDRLREQGYTPLSFNAGERTEATDKSEQLEFANKRAEIWWRMRDALEDESSLIAIPDNIRLKGELTTPLWKPTSTGKVLVESKEDIRKRLDRSTDYADASLMALFGEEVADLYSTTVMSYRDFVASQAG